MAHEIFLPLSNNIIGYLFTIISVVTELIFLSALLVLLAFFECRALSKGRTLSVRAHRMRVLLLTLFAMLMFLVLETFSSVNTSPTSKSGYANQNCLSTKSGAVLTGRQNITGFDEVLFGCMQVAATNFTFYTGNYSRTTQSVTCSDMPVYWYTNGVVEKQLVNGDGVQNCHQRECTIVRAKGNTVFLSEPFEEGQKDENETLMFFPTHVNFDPSGMLSLFAQIAARETVSLRNENLRLRSTVFLNAVETQCAFVVSEKSYSIIPMWVGAPTLSVWVISVLIFIVTMFLRSRVFFNMENVSHWAHKTHRGVDDETELPATVRCIWDGREPRVYISGGSAKARFGSSSLNDVEKPVELASYISEYAQGATGD